MTIDKNLITTGKRSLDAGYKAIDAMRTFGMALVAYEGERGWKTELANELVAHAKACGRKLELQSAKNYISDCIRAAQDGTIDTVRGARSSKVAAQPKAKARFSQKRELEKMETKYGSDRFLQMCKAYCEESGLKVK